MCVCAVLKIQPEKKGKNCGQGGAWWHAGLLDWPMKGGGAAAEMKGKVSETAAAVLLRPAVHYWVHYHHHQLWLPEDKIPQIS